MFEFQKFVFDQDNRLGEGYNMLFAWQEQGGRIQAESLDYTREGDKLHLKQNVTDGNGQKIVAIELSENKIRYVIFDFSDPVTGFDPPEQAAKAGPFILG